MKKIAVIILLVLFLKPIFPVIDYAVNYDYITEVLCINKAKPEMYCNGKCHLMKELAKASDDDKPLTSNKKQNSNQLVDILVAEVASYHFIGFNFTALNNETIAYTNLYSHLDSHAIFHPPIFLS
ncbi:hypothetical protein [Flavobacterium frigidarium]|uniref:hypothetical protein n=1 Tax=Flavobacterium frigidarium TaxID=99286 RepID=UPI0030D96D23